MNNKKIKQQIEKILKKDKRLWYINDETKQQELNQILLIHLSEKYDEKILSLLFSDKQCKDKFF